MRTILLSSILALTAVGCAHNLPVTRATPPKKLQLIRVDAGPDPYAAYLIDPNTQTCALLFNGNTVPVDCIRLAAGFPTAAEYITWANFEVSPPDPATSAVPDAAAPPAPAAP